MSNQKICGVDFNIQKHPSIKNELNSCLIIVFVISGKIEVAVENKDFVLNQEDVIVINQCQTYSIKERSPSIVAQVNYSASLLNSLTGDNVLFNCNSSIDKSKSYKDIQDNFLNLIYEYTYQTHKGVSYLYSHCIRLLDVLIQRYMIQSNQSGISIDEDERLKKLILYVNANYQNDINLTELSSTLYASTSTLSRMFKKKTGIYFAEYVNQVRCRFALSELINTDNSITKIAVDSGFSNSSMLNKVFRNLYGATPTEYREDYKKNNIENKKSEKKDEALIEEIKKTRIFALSQQGMLKIKIDAASQKISEHKKIWNKIINMGSFYSMTQANVQEHALYLHETLGFEYVRLWSIFSKKMLLTDGSASGRYNYDKIDQILDFLVKNGIKPFIDFGSKPNAILNSSSSILYENEYIKFDSKKSWEKAVEDFFIHVCKRYDKKTVADWMVELSYDSRHFDRNNYFDDPDYDCQKLYRYLYKTAKSIIPSIKVCGVSTIINDDQESFKSFADFVKKNDCIPDFFTILMLPYATVRDDKGMLNRVIEKEENFEQEQILLVKDILNKKGIKNYKLIISELNNSISNRNYLNDSVWRACFMIRKIESLLDDVEAVSILMGSDWVSSYYDSIGVVTGSIGILSKETIRKPVYYALSFLNQLSENFVYKNQSCMITRNEENEFYVLCNNYKHFNENYFLMTEDIALTQNMDNIFTDNDELVINLMFEGLNNGRWIIKKRTINSSRGSILSEWKKLQYSTELSSSDIMYLRSICVPQMTIEKIEVEKNILSYAMNLESNEVSLLHIYKD